jgi:hypothetical protein
MPWHHSMLSELPTEAQKALLALTPKQVELLGCEIRGRQVDERTAAFPTDAEGAARGARHVLNEPAALVVDDPLDAALALFRVMRLAIAKGASDDLDSADCMDLWTLADLTDDLLRQHKAATEEAGHRLRAFTHPQK